MKKSNIVFNCLNKKSYIDGYSKGLVDFANKMTDMFPENSKDILLVALNLNRNKDNLSRYN